MVAWIIILMMLKIYPDDIPEWALCILPVLLFTLGIIFSDRMDKEMQDCMNRSNIITLGLVIALPLLDWIARHHGGDRKKFITACGFAIMLSLLTLIDIPMPDDKVYVLMHLRSILQTISVILLMLALYKFFFDESANSWASVLTEKKNKMNDSDQASDAESDDSKLFIPGDLL